MLVNFCNHRIVAPYLSKVVLVREPYRIDHPLQLLSCIVVVVTPVCLVKRIVLACPDYECVLVHFTTLSIFSFESGVSPAVYFSIIP